MDLSKAAQADAGLRGCRDTLGENEVDSLDDDAQGHGDELVGRFIIHVEHDVARAVVHGVRELVASLAAEQHGRLRLVRHGDPQRGEHAVAGVDLVERAVGVFLAEADVFARWAGSIVRWNSQLLHGRGEERRGKEGEDVENVEDA